MRILTSSLALSLLLAPALEAQINDRKDDIQVARRLSDANKAIPRARAAFTKKDYAKAKEEATAIISRAPEASEAHFILAKVLYIEKDYPAALQSMEKALSTFALEVELVSKANGDVRQTLDRKRRELDDQITAREAEIAGMPPAQQAQARTAVDEMKRRRADMDHAAVESMMTAPEQPPAAYHFIYGNILARMNRVADAMKQYEQALKIEPTYADAANNLASLYFATRQPEKALEILDRIDQTKVNQELRKAILQALGRS